MGFYVWKDQFDTGCETVDGQHRGFLQYLNDIHERVAAGHAAAFDREAIGRLEDYAATHFRYEEELMRAVQYTGLPIQEKQHAFFQAYLANLATRDTPTTLANARETLGFLRDWFLEHILTQDRKAMDFLTSEMRAATTRELAGHGAAR